MTEQLLERLTSPTGNSAPLSHRPWFVWLTAALTLAMVITIAGELFGSGLAGLKRAVPTSGMFYACFVLLYLSAPAADLLIYRLLWRLPWLSGFAALNHKRNANDLVLGHSGDVYFYGWARTHAQAVEAPFGAVKDVTLLSGVAGNMATVVLCLVAFPLSYGMIPPRLLTAAAASAAIILGFSLAVLAFSRRVFSLPRARRWMIFLVHCARIAVSTVLLALCWHFALPAVPATAWFLLSAARLLVSRLPLLPNKDLLFANLAIFMLGQNRALSELIAFSAALTLLVNGLLLAVMGLGHMLARVRSWRVA